MKANSVNSYSMPKPIFFIVPCLLAFCLCTVAQKKSISYEQAFKNVPTNILKPLPSFLKWADDEVLIIDPAGGNGESRRVHINLKSRQTAEEEIGLQPIRGNKYLKGMPQGFKNYTLSPDKKLAAYTYDNNLFLADLSSGTITQLTFDGNDSILNGDASWVYYEEILGRASQHKAFWWTPDSKRLVFMRFDDSHVPVFSLYVSEGQYGHFEKQRYPKAGDQNPKVKIGIIQLDTGKITWADFDEEEDQYFGTPFFSPSGQLLIGWINRGQDHLKTFRIDMASGKKSQLYEEKQKTWLSVGGDGYLDFLPDESAFILRSDRTGWSHFYLYDKNGALINAITQGSYNVGYVVKTDAKKREIYFTARKENSARWDLYKTGFDGKTMQRLSFGDYNFSNIHLSPGNKYFTATISNTHTPSSMIVADMKGNIVMEIGNSKGAAFDHYQIPQKKFTRIKTADGLFNLPVAITYPVNFDPNKKYPVLMSVYGGPGAVAVYDTWNFSSSETWWAQERIIQVIADNRSSSHFGKAGMNYIHRQAGIYEIEDFLAVGNWLKQQPWVDSSKLCITGFSFGGYMTCMAMTYGAGVFNYGLAFWPTTDWSLYDTHYTERYMDSPAENPEGYKKTSVFTYASRYKGLLRLVHGTSDDNVHPQNSLQLIDTLQNLGKHFEFMLYPGQGHGLNGVKWQHNKTETYRFYYENLLNRKLPEMFLK